MTDIREIAADMVAMTKAGDFHIGEKYWADDVVSIEAMDGPMARVEGKDAVMGKSAWWYGAHEVHGTTTDSPYINGNQIAIRRTMDITNKESGQRMAMDEVALYTIEDGKIAEERFLY
jgi:ketosteroid isomerase-like protein